MSVARIDAGLLGVSIAVLALEVLQFKIFAFSLDPLTIYLAVGVCLLGLGAAATVLTLVSEISTERASRLAGHFALAGAATIPITHVVFAETAGSLLKQGPEALISLVALTVPYLCFGVTITLVFMSRVTMIGRAYAANLAGSGLGCLIVFPLLDVLGAERALVAVAFVALLGASLLAAPARRPTTISFVVVGVGLTLALARAPAFIVFPPDPYGQLRQVMDRVAVLRELNPGATISTTHLFSRWDRTARVDVYSLKTSIPRLRSRVGDPLEILHFVQDSSAGSILLGVRDRLDRARAFFTRTVYGAGYVRGTVEDVLVIGLGGAPDVQAALYHEAERIVGVDINQSTLDLVRDDFGEFLGHPYSSPKVSLRRMDGRTFVRRTSEFYDLIQMSGTDTKSIWASGSLSVNENYLYTTEAMVELLGRLKPDGLLVINRFLDTDANRLASIAVAGLRELGIDDPERHLMVIAQGVWRCVIVKRAPFKAEEVDRFHEWVGSDRKAPDIVIPQYDWLGASLREPLRIVYSPEPRRVAANGFFQALAAQRIDEFIAEAPLDYSPPVDDRPFFFLFSRPKTMLQQPPPFLRTLYGVVGQLVAVAAAFILVPLLILRWRGLRTAGAGRTLAYFASLGAAFMLIEIGFINRFVLLLGHQSYAITVVLFGLLLGASLGSLLSQRLPIRSASPLRGVLVALILVVLGYSVMLGPLFEAAALASFPARLVLAFVVLTVIGVPLGIPFPVALRSLSAGGLPLVPWGVGINGFASVFGSTIAVPLAMLAGFRTLLLVGAGLYAVALLTAPVALRAARG